MVSNAQRNQEIATNFSLWGEYVDPYGTMSESEFDAMGIDERMALMAEAFPEEDGEDDSSLFSPRNIDQVKRVDIATTKPTNLDIEDLRSQFWVWLNELVALDGETDFSALKSAEALVDYIRGHKGNISDDVLLSALKSAEALVDYIRGHKGFINDDVLDEWAGRVVAEITPILANIDAEEGVDTGTR